MGVYSDLILPCLCHLSMTNSQLMPYRQRTVGGAEGRVLEIGSGSGLNLPLYRHPVHEVLAIEPSRRLIAMSQQRARSSMVPVTFLQTSAEELPFESMSFDVVVMTWTLCSIPRASEALSEIRRVLRANGRLLFVEHGRAPEERVRRWQDRVTPVWRRVSGGCHLNREIDRLITDAGFDIQKMNTGYMPGPKMMTYLYEGSARPRA
jgi:ubiquinone/menaquinone biosynthesis C-methylase UbiE